MWTRGPRRRQVVQRHKAGPQPLGRRRTGRLCLLAGFCLLVLAVMPVAAQAATQHWYKNGTINPEGTVTPVVTFGEAANVTQSNGFGELSCRATAGGVVENPVGGGAGDGRSNAAAFYECKAPQCEEKVLLEARTEGRGTATTENQPSSTKEPAFPGWTNVLEESTVGGVSSVREKIGEPFVTFKTPSPPGMMREVVDCSVAATGQVVAEAIFEGELKPEIGVAKSANLNGTNASKPSKVKFGPTTCSICLHSQVAGEETWSGVLKYLGYNNQELITVNP